MRDSIRPRAFCYRCFRAQSVCLCPLIPVVDNQTRVLVLQHHREQRHPVGTARIARLGLLNSSVVIARRNRQLAVSPDFLPARGLLWPHPHAEDLESIPAAEHPRTLIVLDGTWSQAKRLYRANPWLQAVPHYSIRPTVPSHYRIRRQPRAGCLSTIEALVRALQIIEPETAGLPGLLAVFEHMVDQQITAHQSNRQTMR